ncbi:hypothetical protein EIP91_001415 [Steccherinum ochraceum]|uniref:LIM zinc-binding domain-containing protein n=1 Tax=Steccherinum ochraceum TaxID=92696 RepID=A0A4R0RGF8_9APHY|nr:hypothetical protein EIP91_001415 [Steccherinum ochraceum]
METNYSVHEAVEMLSRLNMNDLSSDETLHVVVQQSSFTISQFLNTVTTYGGMCRVCDEDVISDWCSLMNVSFLDKLFAYRHIFHHLASSSSTSEEECLVVCWVDALLAKMGDATLATFGWKDHIGFPSLGNHVSDSALRAAVQLPVTFASLPLVIGSDQSSPAAIRLAVQLTFAAYVMHPLLTKTEMWPKSGILPEKLMQVLLAYLNTRSTQCHVASPAQPEYMEAECSTYAMVISLFSITDDVSHEMQNVFRPHTLAILLDFVQCILHRNQREDTAHVICPSSHMDIPANILMFSHRTISWCWIFWEDQKLAYAETVDSLSAAWLYHLGRCPHEESVRHEYDQALVLAMKADPVAACAAFMRLVQCAIGDSGWRLGLDVGCVVLRRACRGVSAFLRAMHHNGSSVSDILPEGLTQLFTTLENSSAEIGVKDVVLEGLTYVQGRQLAAVLDGLNSSSQSQLDTRFTDASSLLSASGDVIFGSLERRTTRQLLHLATLIWYAGCHGLGSGDTVRSFVKDVSDFLLSDVELKYPDVLDAFLIARSAAVSIESGCQSPESDEIWEDEKILQLALSHVIALDLHDLLFSLSSYVSAVIKQGLNDRSILLLCWDLFRDTLGLFLRNLLETFNTMLSEALGLTLCTAIHLILLHSDSDLRDVAILWSEYAVNVEVLLLIVAPVVKWNPGDQEENADRWSRTYVTTQKSPTRADTQPVAKGPPLRPSTTGNGSTNRFPRPHSNSEPHRSDYMGSRVSAHIATVTNQRPSAMKHTASASEQSNAEEGILPNLEGSGSELAKVYGSVLQPKESLDSFTCAICGTVFPPDATLFPDPTSTMAESQRFLCRPCFVVNGGSKGDCPSCRRPVLILKSEGGFVEASGNVWHRKCFRCDGCDKDLGDSPMVDLLGRPSCADCFDSCLKRPPRESPTTPSAAEKRSARNTPGREGSPALEELELRLGIIRSRESTPNIADRNSLYGGRTGSQYSVDSSPTVNRLASRTRALSTTSASSPSRTQTDDGPSVRLVARHKSPEPEPSMSTSPLRPRRSYARLKSPEPEISTPSPRRSYGSPSVGSPAIEPTEEAIEEMKRRFLNQASPSPAAGSKGSSSTTTTPTRRSRSRPRASNVSSIPMGDYLDSSSTNVTPQKSSRITYSSTSSSSPALRTAASTSSLRSALKSQSTGATSVLQPDRTGESAYPLLKQQRTGTSDFPVRSDFTGETDYLPRQKTGNTTYLPRMTTGDTVRRHRTGESLGTQHTGYGVFPDSDATLPLRSQKTGETMFEVRTHRTGEIQLRSHITGEELRYQQTGNTRMGEERTGDEEVESLVGTFSTEQDDLIDLRSTVSSGSMSRIPVPLRSSLPSASRYSSNGLGLTTSSSALGMYDPSILSTPDLAADMSDTMSTQSSGPSTPPSVSPPLRKSRDSLTKELRTTPTPASRKGGIDITIPQQIPPNARCANCALPLFSTRHGGKFVTVPVEPSSTGAAPKMYHTSCFKCNVCHEVFEEREGGHAVFVRGEEGACHVRCAPPEKITLRQVPSTAAPSIVPSLPVKSSPSSATRARSQTTSYTTSSRYDPPPVSAAPIFPSARRFGTTTSCPGCNQAVSQMERGVVSGPQGSKWHATCLVCGGKEAKGRRREDGKPGCGKKLDSAAKTDALGNVWCRECLLLLPVSQRQASPVRSPVMPTATGNRSVVSQFTGSKSVVTTQLTGTTTIARQFTGLGGPGPDPALLRQLSGGGLSPTRQLSSSPTKMHDGPRAGTPRYPRPKSVTGVRSTGGEGRGMFLVRQLTGGNTSFSGNDYGL